jgi:hypothetical protein
VGEDYGVGVEVAPVLPVRLLCWRPAEICTIRRGCLRASQRDALVGVTDFARFFAGRGLIISG